VQVGVLEEGHDRDRIQDMLVGKPQRPQPVEVAPGAPGRVEAGFLCQFQQRPETRPRAF